MTSLTPLSRIMQSILPTTLIFFLCPAATASAGPVEDIARMLQGRTGSASKDRREVVRGPLGIRLGCRGDTLEASVQITGVSGTVQGNTATITVTYAGSYTRQGWEVPCQRVSSDMHGVENLNLSGSYTFNVTGKPFTSPTIVWGNGADFGEVQEPGHDSNMFAVLAAQNAIRSAF